MKDLSNKEFGQWTVIKRAPNKGRNVYWLCRCSCGVEKPAGSVDVVAVLKNL